MTHQEQTKDIGNVDQSSVPTSTPQYSTPVPTSISQSSTGSSVGNITLDTDKNVYGLGDFVRVTGTVDIPVEGKTVRLDVYDPEGEVFQPYNESGSDTDKWTPAFPRLSDIQIHPNSKGLFAYRFPLDDPVSGSFIKGHYHINATYGDFINSTMFTAR